MHFEELENYLEKGKCQACDGSGKAIMLDDAFQEVECLCYRCEGSGKDKVSDR